jgi:hypothetical protein
METLVSYAAEHDRYLESPTPFASVLLSRQEAVAPSPFPVETSVVLITSTTIDKPSTTSISRELPVSGSTITTPSSGPTTRQTSTSPTTRQMFTFTTLRTAPSRTSDISPSMTSTTTRNDLPTSSIASTDTAPPASTSESAQPTSTDAAHPTQRDSKHIGVIAGIAVGSIFGAIILALLIYWAYACYRGVNVCNCFRGCGRKHDEERQSDTLPPAAVLYPMSGIGAAPRMNNVPRPLVLPRLLANDRPSRLQRKPAFDMSS